MKMQYMDLEQSCLELISRFHSDEIGNRLAFSLTTELINAQLKSARTSIWMFNQVKNKVECKDLFTKKTKSHQSGGIILRRKNPLYFEALETTKCVVANDARTHQATKSLNESYLQPNGVVSKLSVPIYVKGEIIGIICNEETDHIRDWKISDVALIKEINMMLEDIFASTEN